jgi:hypothetical protein
MFSVRLDYMYGGFNVRHDQSEKTTNIDEKKSWYLILASHVMWINRVPVCVVYPYSIMQYKTVRFSTYSEAFDPHSVYMYWNVRV